MYYQGDLEIAVSLNPAKIFASGTCGKKVQASAVASVHGVDVMRGCSLAEAQAARECAQAAQVAAARFRARFSCHRLYASGTSLLLEASLSID